MRRRQILAVIAGFSAVSLAGCFGNSKTNNPRAVVRAYLEAGSDGDPEAMADLLHSTSPLDPTAGDTEVNAGSVRIDSLTIEQRDLSADEIGALNMRLSPETANSLDRSETAVVATTYETDPPDIAGGGPSGRITVQNSYLTATEGSDWLVVAFELL